MNKKLALILPILLLTVSCSNSSKNTYTGKTYELSDYNYDVFLNLEIKKEDENDPLDTYQVKISPAMDFVYFPAARITLIYRLVKYKQDGSVERSFASFIYCYPDYYGYTTYSVDKDFRAASLAKIYSGNIYELERSLSFYGAEGYVTFNKSSDYIYSELGIDTSID